VLRRISIKNFMSHADSTFELAPCLTVLTGPNNCGKSAVVEALQCVCGNGRGDFMVRHGERNTSVLIETDEGHTIEWRRIKGTPSYVVNGEEVFRSLPGNLHQLLRLPRVPAKEGNDEFDVHFGEQKKPIFLLNDSGSRAATFFASSSDAQYLVQMLDLHRQRTKTANDSARRLRKEIQEIDDELVEFKPLDDLASKLAALEASHLQIQARNQAERDLRQAIKLLEEIHEKRAQASQHLATFAAMMPPPVVRDAKGLRIAITAIAEARFNSSMQHERAELLTRLISPPNLNDTAGLLAAMDAVDKASCHARKVEQFVSALAPTAPPPEQRAVIDLAKATEGLHSELRLVQRANRTRDALNRLAAMTEQKDTVALQASLKNLSGETAKSEAAKRVQQEAEANLAAAKKAIEKWAEDTRSCPTCGAPLNADEIVRELEAAIA